MNGRYCPVCSLTKSAIILHAVNPRMKPARIKIKVKQDINHANNKLSLNVPRIRHVRRTLNGLDKFILGTMIDSP